MESAIKALYAVTPGSTEFPWTFSMPILKKLKKYQARYLPLKPVMKDESTTSNNIQILEDIYGRQFQMKDNNPVFATALRLVGGDLKTWSRIQSAKHLRCEVSERPFDRFDWLLPGLGLWHLRLNMLQLIHRIHWGEVKPADPSTLQYAADRWGRSRVVQPNDFQALEDLIIHSYQSRVVGIWIRCLRREKLNPRRIEEITPWLKAQTSGTSGSWSLMLNQISSMIHASLPTVAIDTQAPTRDQEFHNHQKYCALVEIYLTLRYAIKYADIGLLRHALRDTAIVFQAAAARAPKYGHALLYTLHLVDSPAATMRLQECVLTNSLVNLEGAEDSNFELDRLLELLNNNLKAFQQERSYYSKDSDTLLEHWALNGPYFLELKRAVESSFGRPKSGKHPAKSASEDVWSMALNLAHKSLGRVVGDRFSFNPATDLFTEGLSRLGENVLKYNQQYVQDLSTIDDDDGNEGLEEPADAFEINQIPASPIISANPPEALGAMFVD